jgi:hypothetical protein
MTQSGHPEREANRTCEPCHGEVVQKKIPRREQLAAPGATKPGADVMIYLKISQKNWAKNWRF